jgi:tetratricopeptide (TPR) repeat protein
MIKGQLSSKFRPTKRQLQDKPDPRGVGLWNPRGWRIAVLWILSLLTYSNTFQAGFVFDNRAVILEDARVHAATAQNVRRILTTEYWPDREASGLYRPVTTLSYLLNYAILGNGRDPEGYHWFNLLFHCFNVSLVYALGLAILEAPLPAFALAAIWCLHPVLTESVTNIVGRADLLAALGTLAGVLCYLRGQSSRAGRKVAWLTGLTAAQALGLFSKENAVILIALMLLSDFVWPERARVGKRMPFYVAVAAVCATFFLVRAQSHTHIKVFFTDNPLVGAGFWTARLTAVKVLGKYVWLFLWPASLSPDYSFNAIPLFSWRWTDWEDVKTVLAALLCVIGIFSAIRWRGTQRPLSFFLSFFFIALLPTSNLTILTGSIMAERFVYLPYVGLAGCFVIGIQALAARVRPTWNAFPKTAWVAAGILAICFAARTYARNFDWQDDASLWTRAVEVCPQSAKARLIHGHVLLDIPGRLSDAIAEHEAALRIEPDYPLAHRSLAMALATIPARRDEAIDHFRAVLRSEPNDPQLHYNLGTVLAQVPEGVPEAISELKAAIRLDPNYIGAHNNLGSILASIPGQLPEAIIEYKNAIRLDPSLPMAHYNLGNALAVRGLSGLEEAVAEFRLAIKAQPDFAPAHNNLGTALAQMPGHLPEAIAEFRSAIHANPEYAAAHLNLGMGLSQIPGQSSDATVEFESATRLDPRLASAHYELGMALSKRSGRNKDAIRELEIAYQIQPDPNIRRSIDQLRSRK